MKIYKSQEHVIKFSNDYFKMVYEAAYDADHGKGLKILTAKQMLQRLSIALAHVKASNTSENLLNEFRQIIYCLYKAKEIAKKVYTNI